jgi:hypothetical protein
MRRFVSGGRVGCLELGEVGIDADWRGVQAIHQESH